MAWLVESGFVVHHIKNTLPSTAKTYCSVGPCKFYARVYNKSLHKADYGSLRYIILGPPKAHKQK